MKETYKVKPPKKIVIGDPWYFTTYKGEEREQLIVNLEVPEYCEARVVLESKPFEKYPEIMDQSMTFYFAPPRTMNTYLEGMMYSVQEIEQKQLCVDTCEYKIDVDGRCDTIHVDSDGFWGEHREFTHKVKDRTIWDASVTRIDMPEEETMDSMRKYLKYLFEDVEQIENVEMASEEGVEKENSTEMNM